MASAAARTLDDGTASELRLRADPSQLREARRHVEDVAAAFGLDDDERYDVVLAVNEAVTNAIRHGLPDADGHISLRASSDGRRLTFEVRDHGTFTAPKVDPATESERGRGLAMMACLMDEVQLRLEEGSTTVFLSKRLGGERSPGD